jgi:ABC-type polysaccharide/polyol phosphate transport system ATPase subunit
VSAIVLTGVGKRYVKVEDRASIGPSRGRSRRSDLWALRGVDLEVEQGASLGILGRNGAGKTTLLSMLAGLTAPSEGRVQVHGRVAPLISVGVGFSAELTGRENVHLNAAVLGMSPAELARRFDEIVEFSGVERFLDAPVKTYSSGMVVRLGFSVAVCATPDVLLVDEILAVGDFAFTIRCYDRLAEMRREGTTTVVVSHNLQALQSFCDRGLVLDAGRLLADEPIRQAVGTYMTTLDPRAAGEGAVQVELLRADRTPSSNLQSGDELVVRVTAEPGPVRVAIETERLVVWERHLELRGRTAEVVVPLPLVSGGYAVVAEAAGDRTEAALHITANRMVHGTVDLRARLV